MLKNLIILPDGTELYAGSGQANNIRSCELTECVNSGDELTMGSTCANMLEAKIQTPGGSLSLTTGDEVTLYKVDDDTGTRHKVGLFTLEKPTRPSTNLMKLTGYDRVAKLDKDLTTWLRNLDSWPYTLLTFAKMVCEACSLTLATTAIPNADYHVQQFSKEATGRQLMQWIGEVCCRFCHANADGEIELDWYTPVDVTITPSGALYYMKGSLTFEDYQVAPINVVQLKLTDSDDAYLWPEAGEGANSYIISGNPILNRVSDDALSALQIIQDELADATYTPCEVSVPATLDIHAGDAVQITDKNGATITSYVMTKIQRGQKDTLKCTGSARRDSTTSVNNKTTQERITDLEGYADTVARNIVDAQTQEDIFNKLTNNGAVQGFYIKDGKLYINAEFVQIMNLVAESLKSVSGSTVLTLDGAKLKMLLGESMAIELCNEPFEESDALPILYMRDIEGGEVTNRTELTPHHFRLGGNGTSGLLTFSIIDGKPQLALGADGIPKALSWKDNGDGTFTLIGT